LTNDNRDKNGCFQDIGLAQINRRGKTFWGKVLIIRYIKTFFTSAYHFRHVCCWCAEARRTHYSWWMVSGLFTSRQTLCGSCTKHDVCKYVDNLFFLFHYCTIILQCFTYICVFVKYAPSKGIEKLRLVGVVNLPIFNLKGSTSRPADEKYSIKMTHKKVSHTRYE